MGCKIRVTRDDTGQALSNHQLARLLQSISGVVSVEIAREPDSPLDSIVAAAAQSPSIGDAAESVRKAGREFDKLMFASNNQADVDAYVNRQAERMGHTEITRG